MSQKLERFEVYLQKYEKLVVANAGNFVDDQLAEDVAQDTFLKMYEHLDYLEDDKIKSWLIVVLKNEFLNLLRKRKREVHESSLFSLENVVSYEDNLLDNIIQNEERKQLYFAIQKLPITMREILIESVYLNMRDEEIALLHRTSQENVRQIRSRAKKKLIECMKEG